MIRHSTQSLGVPQERPQDQGSVAACIGAGIGLIGSHWDDSEAYNPVDHRKGFICEYE